MNLRRLAAAACLPLFIATVHAQRTSSLEGFSSEGLKRFSPAYDAEIRKGTIAGAVTLIARNGRIIHHEAYGFHDAAKTRPMPKDALFRMFSMTKPFVSVAAMMLVEEGRLVLSDPVSNWLPELKEMSVMVERKDAAGKSIYETVKAVRPIRVADLLRHTAGFTYPGDAPHPPLKETLAPLRWKSFETGGEFLERLASIPLAWQPGTRFEYGVSTDVLGILLERVTGKSLDALLAEMIFRPLQMRDTGFTLAAGREARLADAPDSDPLKAEGWKWMSDEMRADKRLRMGGAGAISTAHDYYRFCQMLLNAGELDGVRLLSRKTVEQMLANQTEGIYPPPATGSTPGFGFGYGFAIRRWDGYGFTPGSAGEATWGGWAGTTFLIDPKEKVVAINLSQAPSAHSRMSQLFRHILWGSLLH